MNPDYANRSAWINPGEHPITCTIWTTGNHTDCDCTTCAVNLADSPTMAAAVEQAYGNDAT